jgi:hypothetical protein
VIPRSTVIAVCTQGSYRSRVTPTIGQPIGPNLAPCILELLAHLVTVIIEVIEVDHGRLCLRASSSALADDSSVAIVQFGQ